MARKYTRDNRGRFASKGSGATARGGRLKTAAGNKRVTVKASPGIASANRVTGIPKGTIGKNTGVRGLARVAANRTPQQKLAFNSARIEQKAAIAARKAPKPAVAKRNGRPDAAAANIPMRGSRGRALDAQISRNVKQQKATARAADKARNRKVKSDQSRAKALREAHIPAIAKAKGISKGQVESALKAQPASVQVKALKNWVKQNRANVRPAAKAKPAAAKRIKAKAPANTVANKTGSSKSLTRYNSRPVGTLVPARGSINLVPSNKRVPLQLNRENDRAFARTATKAARVRAAAPAKARQKQTTAQRSARATANKQRTVASIMGKSGKRPTPTRKQRRSLTTAEAATRFYATGAVDTLRVNVKKPGFRMRRR